MWQIGDTFDSPDGVWTHYAPWDATTHAEGTQGFLATQRHVDIRSFRRISEFMARPQTDLEAPSVQTDWESPVTQLQLETKLSSSIAEPWVLTGTGLTDLTVGAMPGHGGWPGASLLTTGADIAATLTSGMPGDHVNISAMDYVLLVLPDHDTFTAGTSTLQLTSAVSGGFGSGQDSIAVAFSSNASFMPLLKLPVSAFTQAGFDNTKVTGVRIVLKEDAPAVGLVVTLAGLRAVAATWTDSALDFDTRLGGLVIPITDSGAPYGGDTVRSFEFIRGDLSHNDPIPANGAYSLLFYPGGQTTPNDANGVVYNQLEILTREQKDLGLGTGSLIAARLRWNDADAFFECQRIDMSGGPGGTVTASTLHSQPVNALSSQYHYLFQFELTGTSAKAKLHTTDANGHIIQSVWASEPLTAADLAYRCGRVGFQAALVSRDAYVLDFQAVPTGYAVLETIAATSITPVDGCQLTANFSADENLFDSFAGPDLGFDSTKTISGAGSWTASQAIVSNQFIIDDWNHSYLEFDIWVGSGASLTQPQILLNGTMPVRVSKLGPNQWNHVHVDLARFNDQLTGLPYSFAIGPDPNAIAGLGQFWVDNMTVGRRRVAWAARAQSTGIWRELRAAVNDPHSAIHFNFNERGTDLQVQATALTQDAWIAVGGGLKVFPRYAQLGNMVFDST